MSIESWLDLGTPERVDDAITDMEQAIGWLDEARLKIYERAAMNSEAMNAIMDVANGLWDECTTLRARIAEAEEAKSKLPDYDATADEIARHARARG